ncbi:MAG: methylcrotonoyl-CoA carboxylase [Proteobacteria bacterium]|nr:methylcrotonoyl-CoA carboxylase [Pseudomonadota bacterium]
MILSMSLPTDEGLRTKNQSHHHRLNHELKQRLQHAIAGGGTHQKKKQHSLGKLIARERIAQLKDPDSYFLELSQLAGYQLYPEYEVPCGGLITGVALIAGRACMVIANDQTVKGGSYFPITVKKHLRAQEIAKKNGLPCIYLVDSGGAFLPLQAELFCDRDHFGRIFYNQAKMSAQSIPQFASVHGHCTAGGAYIPAMSDQTIMVKEHGRIFLAGPPLVEAATGEQVTSSELGGWQIHSEHSGLVDDLADSDEDAMVQIRQKVAGLPPVQNITLSYSGASKPIYSVDDLYGILMTSPKELFDPRNVLACLVDGSEFDEFKPHYGKTLVTGWASIMGLPVGVIANHGVLMSDSAQKATHFINLCTMQNTPLLFIQNITGFMVGRHAELNGIAKEGAKMVRAVATAEVAKITLIIGGSYGAGNYAMCGRAYGGDYVFTWPGAQVAIMGPDQAGFVMDYLNNKKTKNTRGPSPGASLAQTIVQTSSAYYATARLWDDGLIEPQNTRQVLASAFASTLFKKKISSPRGVIRM